MIVKLLIIAVLCFYSEARTSYDGYTVVRLMPKTQSQLEYLHNLAMTTTELDFWTYPSAIGATVDVMLSPEQQQSYRPLFQGLEMEKDVLIKDVGALEKKQRGEVNADYVSPFTEEAIPQFWSAYQRYATIIDLINTLAAQNPSIASVETIGRSHQNREIRLIKVGVNQGGNKPIYFIDSLIHAREWITGATTTFFLQYLIDGYKNGTQEVVQLLTNYDVYILPILNPDGYEFTHTDTRLWRKTRMANSGSTCIGTDANRNWDHCFLCSGASTNPCSETYAGTSAFNQPESKAIADYLLSLSGRVKIYIAVHSYSQLLLYPWGNSTANSPDQADQHSRGSAATAALTAVYNTRYTTGSITNTLYAASGSAVDWGYCVARAKYTYTIELRDTGTYGFQLPASQIVPSGLETNRFFITLAQQVSNDPNPNPSFTNCR